ncbi:MAG: PD40 domain-containing protein [Planctomycetes bacterium]|nr:PD40 domain-containing protein [Planctomycetota bacterium]
MRRPPGHERWRAHARAGWLALLIGWWLAVALSQPALAGTVHRISLDGEWRHWVDESNHEPVTVPFSVEPIGSIEAYQRLFDLPAGMPTQRVLLYFHGVVGQTQVYLNGVLLGEHGSYTPFWFDAASLLKPGGQNDLIVVIDDRRDNTTIPYEDIPWVNYSGIIRGVELICGQDAILLSSRPRYTLTPDLGHADGTVTVEAFADPGVPVYFTGALLQGTPDNWTVAALLAPTSAPADLTTGIATSSLTFALDSPALWSPETPNRYYLYVVAGVDGAIAHERLIATGFRSVSVAGNEVRLNNQPLLLKGVSYHGIYPGTGFVATEAEIREDLVRLKSAGVNYVRTIHYPQDPRVLDVADEIGLLISEEAPAWANFWDPLIRQGLYDMLTEMIHRDMHHPSIFLWISGNARAWPMPYAKDAQDLIKGLDHNRLASYVIDNDEYDPDTIAQDVAFFHEAGLDLYMKISWWFYYVEYLQDAWTNFPKDVPIVIAEFGREGNDREPIVVDGDQEYWMGEDQQADAVTEMLEAWRPHLPQYDADEHLAGLIYFNYEDLDWPDIGRYLPNHIPSVHHGLVYDDRQLKRVLGVLGDFYSTLPDHFVGLPAPQDEEVERRFHDPTTLDGGVNHAYRDSGPSLSAHGDVLYFASDGPDYVGLPRIFFTQRVNGTWTAPALVDMPQENEPFAFRKAPCISYDGQTLFFTRAVVSGIYVARTRIWYSRQVDGVWTDPQDLGDLVNYPDAARITSDPSLSADGNTLFFSSDRPGGFGRTDIWTSRRIDGEWTEPTNLGPAVNTPAGESEPSISADGRTLYFSSDRPGGVGSSDIWVAHLVGSTWSTPKNLGPELNSPGADREPEVSKDVRYLLFTGIRSGGAGLSDVWVGRSIFAAADFDHDGDADSVDFGHLQVCLTGPSVGQTGPECLDTDLDGDGDTDADDLAAFVACASGPALAADPSCGSHGF